MLGWVVGWFCLLFGVALGLLCDFVMVVCCFGVIVCHSRLGWWDLCILCLRCYFWGYVTKPGVCWGSLVLGGVLRGF